MKKLQRIYRLTIEMNDGSGVIVIEPPLTIQFSIQRQYMASINSMTLAIYNLGEATRNRIFRDRFDTGNYYRITLEGGYGSTMSTIFKGNIFEANSARMGANVITNIVARDGGFDTYNSKTFQTVQKGTSLRDVIKTLIGDFPNLNQGTIGEAPGQFKRPVVLDGNTFGQIKKYTSDVFIDLEQVNVLANNEALSTETTDLLFIDPSTGLLETPRRDNGFMTVTTLFEPQATIGQVVSLASTILPIYNGTYKLVGITHQGIISDAVNGRCQTILNLYMPEAYGQTLKEVKPDDAEASQ